LVADWDLEAVLVVMALNFPGDGQQKSRASGAALRMSDAGSVRHRTRALGGRRRRNGNAICVIMELLMGSPPRPVNLDCLLPAQSGLYG